MIDARVIETIIGKMNIRKNNYEETIKNLGKIAEFVHNMISDSVTGYCSKKTFYAKVYVNSEYGNVGGEYRFCLIDGYMGITLEHSTEINDECDHRCIYIEDVKIKLIPNVYPTEIKYVNFGEMLIALEDFLKNLQNIKLWDEEAKEIQKITEQIKETYQTMKKTT